MAKAISIASSQYWEGNDGPWSSFAVQIGTPAQTVRVLPGSSGSSLWTVLPEGCSAPEDPSDCGLRRGVLFTPDNSTTWERVGDAQTFFQLPFETEASLGYTGNALIGFDDVELGWPGAGGPRLQSQVIAGYATKDPMLGLLGLTPRPVNVTSFIDQHQSPLGTLANAKNRTVPSSSWAYTAGARYRRPQQQGSLTFGGYDSLRGDLGKALKVPMSIDTNRDLVVAVNSIRISKPSDTQVAGLPILALIDSVVPDIWLPLAACQVFESAFGLTWNTTSEMYWVNDTQHTALLAQNAAVTFSLGATVSAPAQEQTTFTLPYSAFDLEAKYPIGGLGPNDTMRYFPLQRAANDTQFTLGRTFLQEAYLGVDYDRSQLSLTQALFPDDPTAQNIVSIYAPGTEPKSLSTGVIVGIAVGGGAVVALVLAAIYFFWRKRRNQAKEKHYEEVLNKADEEMRRQNADELDKLKPELDATTTAVGGPQRFGRQELDAGENGFGPKTPWSSSDGGSVDEKFKFGSPGGGPGTPRHEVGDNMVNEAMGSHGAVAAGGRGVVGELDSQQRAELSAGDGEKRGAVELPA